MASEATHETAPPPQEQSSGTYVTFFVQMLQYVKHAIAYTPYLSVLLAHLFYANETFLTLFVCFVLTGVLGSVYYIRYYAPLEKALGEVKEIQLPEHNAFELNALSIASTLVNVFLNFISLQTVALYFLNVLAIPLGIEGSFILSIALMVGSIYLHRTGNQTIMRKLYLSNLSSPTPPLKPIPKKALLIAAFAGILLAETLSICLPFSNFFFSSVLRLPGITIRVIHIATALATSYLTLLYHDPMYRHAFKAMLVGVGVAHTLENFTHHLPTVMLITNPFLLGIIAPCTLLTLTLHAKAYYLQFRIAGHLVHSKKHAPKGTDAPGSADKPHQKSKLSSTTDSPNPLRGDRGTPGPHVPQIYVNAKEVVANVEGIPPSSANPSLNAPQKLFTLGGCAGPQPPSSSNSSLQPIQ